MKYILSFKEHLKNPFANLGKNSRHDWYFILLCTCIGIIVAIVIDITLFLKLTSLKENTVTGDNLSAMGISKEDVSSAIEIINTKNLKSSFIPPSVDKDPSM